MHTAMPLSRATLQVNTDCRHFTEFREIQHQDYSSLTYILNLI